MADKSKSQRQSGAARDQTDENSRDNTQAAKGKGAKNLEGWLRSKELQPPD
jgi:hypothetical protein